METPQRPTGFWPLDDGPAVPPLADVFAAAEAQAHRLPFVDRHGCVKCYGPMVLFTMLPTVGASSYDLLRAADPDEWARVVRTAEAVLNERLGGMVLVPSHERPDAWLTPIQQRLDAGGVDLGDGRLGLPVAPTLGLNAESEILASLALTTQAARQIVSAAGTTSSYAWITP